MSRREIPGGDGGSFRFADVYGAHWPSSLVHDGTCGDHDGTCGDIDVLPGHVLPSWLRKKAARHATPRSLTPQCSG